LSAVAGPPSEVLLRTRGVCPTCVEEVPARFVVDGGSVYLEKECPDHGEQRALLSRHPDYYRELLAAYRELMPESLPQRDFILRLTARCNMSCPICLASSDQYEEEDLTFEDVAGLLASRGAEKGRRLKLDLMGAEPTLHPDLERIIRLAHEGGHITALHTNGIEIAQGDLLRRLVDAGLDEVHLQLDGFDDAHDQVLRGRPMGDVRRRVLEQLERVDVATDLVVTLIRGCNEDQMTSVLDYAARHPFVKEVFYLGMRSLGRATGTFEAGVLAPDEVIDDLELQSGGSIRREEIRVFQKLYFALLAAFRVRKCFYIHHYMVMRDGEGYRPISDYIDLAYLEPHLDRFRSLLRRSRALALPYLAAHALRAIVRRRGYPLLADAAVLNLMLLLGFDLSRIRRRVILLGFISACDPWIHCCEVAANCGKGELARDIGLHEAGADANVARERLHRGRGKETKFSERS
jgi:pyruvate-formate lyase-activating enzyme